MGFAEEIEADLTEFLDPNTLGAVELLYTPRGGVQKAIYGVVTEGQESEFQVSEELDYDVTEVLISALDDTTGQVSPSEVGRGGAGDEIEMPETGVTYYVHKILEDGRDSKSGMHRLLAASTEGPLE